MTWRNLTITFEEGLITTWRLPRFSAFDIVLRQSARTLILVIYRDKDRQRNSSAEEEKPREESDERRAPTDLFLGSLLLTHQTASARLLKP
jgi:hypothetical protein